MLFKHLNSLQPEDPVRLPPSRGRLRFWPEGSPLQGVLDLVLDLSATPRIGAEHEQSPSPDKLLQPLALPVPVKDQTRAPGGKLRVLPGAPLAFILAQEQEAPFIPIIDLQADTLTLSEEWFKTYGDFRETEIKELDGYFRGEVTGRIRSFVSIPLRRTNSPAEIIGVLNVHCDQPNILRTAMMSSKREQAGPATQFAHLIDPILQILADLLDLLVSLRA
jgi:hypothetical protein